MTRRRRARGATIRRVALLLAIVASGAAFAQEAPTIAGHPYTKLATRDETAKALRATLSGVDVDWSPWRALGPFPFPGGSKAIASPLAAEQQLAALSSNGLGPDAARFPWRELDHAPEHGGADGFGVIDLKAGVADALSNHAVVYLHRAITARVPGKLRVKIGSDDGLRLWFNGKLLIDAGVERGFEPEQHVITLPLERGVNHLFAKVTQDAGGWSFELAPDVALDRAAEVELDWRLQLDFPEGEAEHFRVTTLAIPQAAALEVGGVDLLPDGRPIVCTRRGDVFVIDGAYDLPATKPQLHRFATGLQEPLGVAVRPDARAKQGWSVWLAQRSELTRLVDVDGDLAADLFETVCDQWQISGNYHEYAFGPRFDPDGNAWVTLNLGHTGGETVMGALLSTRGCAVRVRPDGVMEIAADGLRSPDALNWLPGIGMAYTDNQGDYVATNKLSPMPFGSFHGHQASLPFRTRQDGSHWKKGDAIPERQQPAIWFPYNKMGQSASDFVVDESGGKFGPFTGQLFVGDQTHATVMRVALETVSGANGARVVQGACFPFRAGFKSGVHRLCFARDGSLFVGLTDRGWGSRGTWRDGLERVLFTGETPFEMAALHATADGFDVEFTKEVEPTTAASVQSWRVTSWTYEYHPEYGSAEMDSAAQRIADVRVDAPRRIHLTIDRLRVGYVHELGAPGVRSRDGAPLLHDVAYYTLQTIPAAR